MSLVDLILGFLLPSDCRDECLGDLYEGYFILRERGTPNFTSILVTIGRAILLIMAALKMRWDDIIYFKKEVQHTLKTKHSRHYKNTSNHSDSPKSSLQAVYCYTKQRQAEGVTGYDLSVKHHNPLFRLASKLLKYFLLTLLGFMITYVLSTSLGGLHIIVFLMMHLLRPLVLFGIIALSLFTTAMIIESWR